ncbi:MAG: tRNA uridine-5-carboxymethylaminomethyl(34) synthesis GTPase MnmE [Acidobacteria bacterium]|nr:tRNA uridine-5-carboxymethylaminomethyl(34) synthesis GTPase MnmE [Acidobacteriota bacterium]
MSPPATIFALSSGAGPAGVAVIRISGPEAGPVLERLSGRLPKPRVATLTRLADLDLGLALWFPGPASFTGEDVAELHVHGGRAVIAGLLARLGAQPECRLAEPGEFTRRAFDHGKLDLTAAEGLADLINAETEAQARQALRQMRGALAGLYEGWRKRLIAALALLEADIDFAEEGLPEDIADRAMLEVVELAGEIARHLADDRRGERLRDGLSLVILGPPNAGKSSLLNWLARRDAAIVSAVAGTTRDVIEVHLDLGGYPVVVADTAGLRESADVVECEGVRRALARAGDADLKLVLLDASSMPPDAVTRAQMTGEVVVAVNKIDLVDGRAPRTLALEGNDGAPLPISLRTGQGLEDLLKTLTARVAALLRPSEAPALTRLRHREALQACSESLTRAAHAAAPELRAEDIRLAARAIGRITGRFDVEDVLDVIFREFCIGK